MPESLLFYERAELALRRAGKTRNKFCKDHNIPWSTVSNHWGTDRLPTGDILVKLAQYTDTSLDYLVLGRDVQRLRPSLDTLFQMLDNLSDEQIAEVTGAIKSYLLFNQILPRGPE